MYNSFFNLTRSPFSMTPDTRSLFLTDIHREALAGLSYAISEQKGFVVLEGQAGTGKTTLIRKLLEMLPQTEALVSFVVNPILSADDLLELLLIKFGLEDIPGTKAKRLTRLEQLLLKANRDGMVPVLIVDEAHKLNNEVLEEIRLLTNFENNDCKLLQIVLTGQPELRDVLNRPDLWQLKQRIAVRLRIEPLTSQQLKQYIEYRWVRAGGTLPTPFRSDVVDMIAVHSCGIPRMINSICDNALLSAYSESNPLVTPQILSEVVKDLDLPAKPSVAQAAPVENKITPVVPKAAPESAPLRLAMIERHLPKAKTPDVSFPPAERAKLNLRAAKAWFLNRIYSL
jgi:general secretion pathway protein A